MSQMSEIRPHAMGADSGAAAPDTAAAAIRPRQPGPLHNLSDGDLADEHRGQSFAKARATERLAAIEAELTARGLESAKGKLGVVERKQNVGLLDLPRVRAHLGPELCRTFWWKDAPPLWRSRTLRADERG